MAQGTRISILPKLTRDMRHPDIMAILAPPVLAPTPEHKHAWTIGVDGRTIECAEAECNAVTWL